MRLPNFQSPSFRPFPASMYPRLPGELPVQAPPHARSPDGFEAKAPVPNPLVDGGTGGCFPPLPPGVGVIEVVEVPEDFYDRPGQGGSAGGLDLPGDYLSTAGEDLVPVPAVPDPVVFDPVDDGELPGDFEDRPGKDGPGRGEPDEDLPGDFYDRPGRGGPSGRVSR